MIERRLAMEHTLVREGFEESDQGIDLVLVEHRNAKRLDGRAVQRCHRRQIATATVELDHLTKS